MKDPEFIEKLKRFYYIPMVTALVAVLPIDSWSFYMDVRWVLTVSFVSTLILLLVDAELLWWAPLVAILGVLHFDPINIVTHSKGEWVLIDLITVAFFFGITYTLEEAIKSFEHDKKIEASLPKDHKEKQEQRAKQWAAELDAKDKKVLELRAEKHISKATVSEYIKNYPSNPMLYGDRLTRAERDEAHKNQSRSDAIAMITVVLIIAAIAYGWHLYKVHYP